MDDFIHSRRRQDAAFRAAPLGWDPLQTAVEDLRIAKGIALKEAARILLTICRGIDLLEVMQRHTPSEVMKLPAGKTGAHLLVKDNSCCTYRNAALNTLLQRARSRRVLDAFIQHTDLSGSTMLHLAVGGG